MSLKRIIQIAIDRHGIFCVHAQKILIVILDNKSFQLWIICANTQILIGSGVFLRKCAEIPNKDLYNSLWICRSQTAHHCWILCADRLNLNRDVENFAYTQVILD